MAYYRRYYPRSIYREVFSPERSPSPPLEVSSKSIFCSVFPIEHTEGHEHAVDRASTKVQLDQSQSVTDVTFSRQRTPSSGKVIGSDTGSSRGHTRPLAPIPCLKGPLSKPGSNGFSLEKALGWSRQKYTDEQKKIRGLCKTYLDTTVTYSKQPVAQQHAFFKAVVEEMPYMKRYADMWPAKYFAMMYTKNTSQAAKPIPKPTGGPNVKVLLASPLVEYTSETVSSAIKLATAIWQQGRDRIDRHKRSGPTGPTNAVITLPRDSVALRATGTICPLFSTLTMSGSDIASILQFTLAGNHRDAETIMEASQSHPMFSVHLLRLVLDKQEEQAIRSAASLYLKNFLRNCLQSSKGTWTDESKELLKNELAPAMVALSDTQDEFLRVQIAECVSLVAIVDFPRSWESLVEQLTGNLRVNNLEVILGTLETARAAFHWWSSRPPSDALFSDMKTVLRPFLPPFLEVLSQTASIISSPPGVVPNSLLGHLILALVEIICDIVQHDIPTRLERKHDELFHADHGRVCATIDSHDYPYAPVLHCRELLARTHSVNVLSDILWNLLRSEKQLSEKVIIQALNFVATSVRASVFRDVFSSVEAIEVLVRDFALPYLPFPEGDLEELEASPFQFVRREFSSTENASSRMAARGLIRTFMAGGFSKETTSISVSLISNSFGVPTTPDPHHQWKLHNQMFSLYECVAAPGGTGMDGNTLFNPEAKISEFYEAYVVPQLREVAHEHHVLITLDVLRFLLLFHSQIETTSLESIISSLIRWLNSPHVAIHTYAAAVIGSILSSREPTIISSLIRWLNSPHVAIHTYAAAVIGSILSSREPTPIRLGINGANLVEALLLKLEWGHMGHGETQNYTIARYLTRAVQSLKEGALPSFRRVLPRVSAILSSNLVHAALPDYYHHLFDCTSYIIREGARQQYDMIFFCEDTLLGTFAMFISHDTDVYIPYVFAILAQMIEIRRGLPEPYRPLLAAIWTPSIWQSNFTIPSLVVLIQAFLRRDLQCTKARYLDNMLGVVQQRLIPFSARESWGFHILTLIFDKITWIELKPLFGGISKTLLTRLQVNTTRDYNRRLASFLMHITAHCITTPEAIMEEFEHIQPGASSKPYDNSNDVENEPRNERQLVDGIVFWGDEEDSAEPSQFWKETLHDGVRRMEPGTVRNLIVDLISQFLQTTVAGQLDEVERTAFMRFIIE
ncbi:armadillo-type protein [Amylostereum chailletii]|nr:armadillo-type protein [Amylostereum chailletii]